MKRLWMTTVLFFSCFCTEVCAEERVQYVVIAADHSGSMHKGGHILIQNNALITAVINYGGSCGDVVVIYLPWGSKPHDSVRFVLTSEIERQHFALMLRNDLAKENLLGTLHEQALKTALAQLEAEGVTSAVLLFTTDESGTPVKIDLPEEVLLFKVSVGSDRASAYLEKDFLSGVGYHYHAADSVRLEQVISDVFAMASLACTG